MIIIGEKINGSIPSVAEAELLILTVALLFRKRKKWKH